MSSTTIKKPATCMHCKQPECAPRYMTLSYKFSETIPLQAFADAFRKVAKAGDLTVNHYLITGFKGHPLIRHVWLDISNPPTDHDLRLKLTLPAPHLHRPVLPTVDAKHTCVAALGEVKKAMVDMNEEGEGAIIGELTKGVPGVLDCLEIGLA